MDSEVGKYPHEKYGWAKQEVAILLKPYLELIGNLNGKNVLDIGCGTGWLTKIIAEKARKVIGIDISEGMIKRANEENPNKNILYRVLSADSIGSLNESFDIVTSSLTFHVIYPDEKLAEVLMKSSNLLKKNGKIVLLVPHPCFAHLNNRPYNTYTFRNKFSYFKKDQIYDVRLISDRGTSEFSCPFYSLRDYFRCFNKAGLVVRSILEPAVPENLKREIEYGWNLELKYPFYIIFELTK